MSSEGDIVSRLSKAADRLIEKLGTDHHPALLFAGIIAEKVVMAKAPLGDTEINNLALEVLKKLARIDKLLDKELPVPTVKKSSKKIFS